MFRVGTVCSVADNSGAKLVQCIKVLKGSSKVGRMGDIIVVAVKEVQSREGSLTGTKGIQEGSVQKALILRTKKVFSRKDGTSVRFGNNAVTLLKKQGQPAGTRLFGPVLEELRLVKNMRVLSLSAYVL